ncbi:phBC6A51 family helix-turn-helix protein [Pontibacillus salipaludis]|uniref:phBC6A51 family helix-turn-helix protein n=1 Tax=Pontibacillus salipaludis TaxID=1697394 RepID=UPI0031EEC2C9
MPRKKKRSKQPSQVPPLDERHYLAIILTVEGWKQNGKRVFFNKTEIAELVGVSRMQLYRWEQRKDYQHKKNKALNRYLRELRKEIKGQSLTQLALGGDTRAMIRLVEIQCLGKI